MPIEPTLMELKGVGFTYPTGLTPALANVDLAIYEGEFVGLIGPTGSGKSTLVQLLNGLLQPTEGIVLYRNRPIGREISGVELRREVGVVFQFPETQLFEPTVFDDVAFGPKNLGLSRREIERRVFKALEAVGLGFEEFAHRSPFSLSGGEMRRAAIAGVLAMEPKMLVLDEPTCGLDARGRNELLEMLATLNSAGLTVILVTHNMDEVARLAMRLVVLDDGRIVLDGPPATVFSQADRITEMGLDLPATSVLLRRLRERGIEVPTELFEISSTCEAIVDALRRRA
ncbi:MAG: energy-coupling factor transporter ATPase [Actinobacteria bacterium]|nr:energy-coupling factor transporter ATPase [Actinomycetota bacterium]